MRGLWRKVTGVQWRDARIKALEGVLDGAWREVLESEEVVAAVMCDYDELKAVLAVREREVRCLTSQVVALQRILREREATGG